MLLRTTISRNIKRFTLAIMCLAFGLSLNAQQIKIDGVAVVIGKNIVLDSDIDKFKREVEQRSEGKITISNCEMLEELMLQKLIAHHAVIDSVTVSDAEISTNVQNSINFFVKEFGSEEKVVQVYGFNDIEDLRKELYSVQKENLLIQKEQTKITEKIDVTPEEVRLYYNGLKEKNELPEISAEVALSQIVMKAKPTDEENERILKKLNEIKKQLEDGASFKMKAIINSDDPGVTQNGGQYTITKESPFIKEFKEMAFSLDLNQISQPFKSQFGYHIMQLNAIKGEARVASHILMQPKVPDDLLKKTSELAQEVVQKIRDGKMTFAEAVKQYSDDEDTKNNDGLIVNPYTGEHRFDMTRMDPALYARVTELKKGELTDAFFDQNQSGEKMFKFILVKDRTDNHTANLVIDYVKIQELALQKKKEETISKWAKEKINDTYIKISTGHNKCSFEKNWKKETNK